MKASGLATAGPLEASVDASPAARAFVAEAIVAVALFFSAACGYLVSYGGRLRSTDELEMFTTAWSLVVHRTLAIDQLRWALKTPGTGFDLFGADGRLYSYIEPLHSLLAVPFVMLARALPGVGNIELALLLNVAITALVAPVLYAWLRWLDYSRRVSALTALVIAFGTLLWPYSKTFFREPLGALTTAGLFLAWTIARQTSRPSAGILTGLLLGLHGGVRLSNLATAGGLLVGAIWRVKVAPWRVMAFAALGLVIALGIVFGLEAARYGGRLHALQVQSGLPAAPIYVGLYGLLLSPGKGFIWYSPVALLALFGVREAYRRHPQELCAIGLTFALWLLVLAMYYDWWGGLGWGPRFLTALVPLLALPIAVVLERALRVGASGFLRAGVAAVVAFSVLVQVLAVTGDYGAYLADLVERFGTTVPETTVLMSSPLLSPVLGQIEQIALGRLDLVLVSVDASGLHVAWLPLLVGIIAAVGFGWLSLRPPARPIALLATALVGAACVVGLSAAVLATAATARASDDIARAPEVIMARAEPGDVVVSLLEHETHRYLNTDKSSIPNVGLALAPVAAGSRTEATLYRLIEQPRTLWLIMQGVDKADEQNGVERWLAEHAYRGEQEWAGGVRIVPFRTQAIGPAAPMLPSVPARISPAELQRVVVSAGAPAGGEITVETEWAAEHVTAVPLRIFVNLVGLDGSGLVTSIAEPLDGHRPSTEWLPGEVIVDHRLLRLPADATPGVYRLEVGLYDPEADRRLPIEGASDATAVVAAYVAVRPAKPIVPPASATAHGATLNLPGQDAGARLLAFEEPASVDAGTAAEITLYWQSVGEIGEDLAVFVHALDASGKPAFQRDATAGGRYPSGVWLEGEVVADRIVLDVPEGATGRYRLVAGLYRRSTGERLTLADGGDMVELGVLEVRVP